MLRYISDPEEADHAPKSRDRKEIPFKWLLLSLVFACLATPWLIGPRCPDRIVIATGQPDGAYFRFANEYKKRLAKHGVTLEVRETAGSVENLELLQNEEVSIAMVQGGTGDSSVSDSRSLVSLYPEPVWIFYREENSIEKISDLNGLRIAIGPEGSGVRSIALELLGDNGIVDCETTTLSDESNSQAVENLKSGQIDAAFFVISSDSVVVNELITNDGIQLLDISRAASYQQRHRFLSKTILPEGVVNFQLNKPAADITLLAPTANLVVNGDFHHALVPLVLEAIQEVHEESDQLLVNSESFPSPKYTSFQLNTDAKRYFKSGPSLLYRYFPFWVAAWLDRLKLILLPMLTLLIPLIKIAPPVYRWRIRSKIYRWYRVLHDIDQKLTTTATDAEISMCEYQDAQEQLENLEQELSAVSVPLSYMEEFYNLRIHVSYVKNKLGEHHGSETLSYQNKAA